MICNELRCRNVHLPPFEPQLRCFADGPIVITDPATQLASSLPFGAALRGVAGRGAALGGRGEAQRFIMIPSRFNSHRGVASRAVRTTRDGPASPAWACLGLPGLGLPQPQRPTYLDRTPSNNPEPRRSSSERENETAQSLVTKCTLGQHFSLLHC